MCRAIVFTGTCTRCAHPQSWDDLAQKLPCLEAKNAGVFGECEPGIFVEEHVFDQECERCAEEDEGVGDIGAEGKEEGEVVEGKEGGERERERERKKSKTEKT